MREISIVFILLYLITITSSQTISSTQDKYVFSVSDNSSISLRITNLTSGTNYALSCTLNPNVSEGYANAIFNQSTFTPLSSSETVNVTLRDLKVGRVRDFECKLNSSNASVTKYLSIQPTFRVFVCDNVNVVADSQISFTVRFSSPLTVAPPITCSNKDYPVEKGITSINLIVPYSAATINCTFGSSPIINVSVNEINKTINFSPNIIESNSPIIKLNLISNYGVTVNCTIVSSNEGPTCSPKNQVNWTLSPNQFTFSETSYATLLTMSKSGPMLNSTEQYYVVCCTSSGTELARANVTINNSTLEYTTQSNGTETSYGDLQFVRLSDCPCDLTVGICDQNCCCDPSCKCVTGVIPFTGPYGGYFNDTLSRSCNYQDDLTRQPYHSLLCVVNESPNILGDYYPMQSIVNDYNTLSAMLTSSNRNTGFQIKVSNVPSSLTSMYIPISTNYISQILTSRYLYLPRQVVDSSKCDLQNPIAMLQSYDSNCSYYVTNENCLSMTDPRLSSFFYLTSTTVNETNCTNNMGIKAFQDNITVFTFYKCSGIPCSWDNGYTLPPSPTQCQNVVSSVLYTIYYNDSKVIYINANISLINATVNATLDQRFTVSFVSTSSTRETAATQSFPVLQSILKSTVTNISGRYGYDDGMPIITADDLTSTTFGKLRTLPISTSGNCDKKLGNNVLFRQNSLVQCKFDISNMTCTDKRDQIKSYLDSLVNFSHVAIYGNPSSGDVIRINKPKVEITNNSDPYYPSNQNSNLKNPINNMIGYCANVTTGITVTIYYSRQGKARNQYINNIVSVVQRYQFSNVSYYSPVGANSTLSDSIMLTAYYNFVLVSSNISGTQNTDNNPQAVCLFDVCINELFYPWMYNYEGKQGFYEESFGLFLLGLAIFLLVVTYPWW